MYEKAKKTLLAAYKCIVQACVLKHFFYAEAGVVLNLLNKNESRVLIKLFLNKSLLKKKLLNDSIL